jgi:hypothetical protein
MRWSFWLIQVPAYIVDVWLFLYRLVLLVVSLALFFMSLTILALAASGSAGAGSLIHCGTRPPSRSAGKSTQMVSDRSGDDGGLLSGGAWKGSTESPTIKWLSTQCESRWGRHAAEVVGLNFVGRRSDPRPSSESSMAVAAP